MLLRIPRSARYIQRFDDLLNSAIHITYHISLHSSSMCYNSYVSGQTQLILTVSALLCFFSYCFISYHFFVYHLFPNTSACFRLSPFQFLSLLIPVNY
ncbi:Putative uncharacterized protein ART3 [Leucoagaricus sp. SymC.cos]|nr:Putative uncharacterized protein ART3 [Leucoagaricus sp. SymC.cos]